MHGKWTSVKKHPIVVAHTCNLSTWEAKEDCYLFKASLGYIVDPVSNKSKNSTALAEKKKIEVSLSFCLPEKTQIFCSVVEECVAVGCQVKSHKRLQYSKLITLF